MIARYGLVLIGAVLPALAQVSEAAILLAKVKGAMGVHLQKAPNYSCLQTVERYQRRPGAQRPFLVDVLRLEVAFVEGKELFAWPGSKRFEDRELREIVGSGAFGTGNFVLHARAIFLGDGSRFEYLGLDEIEGRASYKFSYEMPLFRSGYQISNQSTGLKAEVAHHGNFWVDRTSLELIRLVIEAEDIPVALEISGALDQLEYARVPLGEKAALLPMQSELRLTDARGVESINRMRLSRCKLFGAESTISFADLDAEKSSAAKARERVYLPAGLEIDLGLEEELSGEVLAVGDAITARLRRDLRDGKDILFPKGAVATGRIIELTRHENPACFTVAFLMEELSSSERVARLWLRLLRTEPSRGAPQSLYERRGNILSLEYPIPSKNGFLWFGSQLKLNRGFATIWETQSVAP